MRGLLAVLKVVVVGFALLAGGRALYRNRDKVKGDWKKLGGFGGAKDLTGRLSASKLLGSVGSLKNLAGQFSRSK
jgi:hypothetical protein